MKKLPRKNELLRMRGSKELFLVTKLPSADKLLFPHAEMVYEVKSLDDLTYILPESRLQDWEVPTRYELHTTLQVILHEKPASERKDREMKQILDTITKKTNRGES